MGNGSRVNREIYARFCERLRVKFPGPTHQISLPAAADPVEAAIMEQLQQKVEAKDRVIAAKDQALAAAEAIIRQLKERFAWSVSTSTASRAKSSPIYSWTFSITSRRCRAKRSKRKLPPVRCLSSSRRSPASKSHAAKISSIQAASSCPRIWSVSKRSSPAQPSSAVAASAAPRPA